ncbi:MAG: methyltransferase domain-containing protein [Ktedonobacteraceae bacterium]|nr:methyltransferase domain-containing protein [Ktedonobacteraceae bacterium]
MEDRYRDGTYLEKNPGWHVEESAWKARQIGRMLRLHRLMPETICDVGCGVGEVLREVQKRVSDRCTLWGYDISPQAIALSASRANEQLHFKLADIRQEQGVAFDLLLVMDVIEHLEDFFSFLREIQPKSQYKILHIPLDLSVQTLLRRQGLLHVHDTYGHIHYFTKEIALALLQDAGYEVLDSFYTSRAVEIPTDLLGRKLLRYPRKLLFALHQDFAVRLVGGFSLLVLAR